MLTACRKVISDNGHLGAMQNVDTLINVAQTETDRCMTKIKRQACESNCGV